VDILKKRITELFVLNVLDISFDVANVTQLESFASSNLTIYIKDCLLHYKNIVITLEGDLGSGKTTLTSYLLKTLILRDINITSPTFNILNQYQTSDGLKINHYDLYRIKHSAELEEIGFYETLFDGLTIIEWPSIAKDYIFKYKSNEDSAFLGITILKVANDENARKLKFV
jgi:tRNA threonylcarbamoyl adenosine modification protein YjeE